MPSSHGDDISAEQKSLPTEEVSALEKPGIDHGDKRRDDALDFLDHHRAEAQEDRSHDASFTKSLRRKIDWRLMPFLCVCYTLNFVDKVLLNVSGCVTVAY
jgi:hypothetical protein